MPSIRVVKLGGSLLEFDRTPEYLRRWLSLQNPMQTGWIIGGGKPVEEIRRQDKAHDRDATEIHHACIELMDRHSRLVSEWFPSWQVTDDLYEIGQHQRPHNRLWITSKWIKRNAALLPTTWDVTSDSIAATIAIAVNAAELVLLKSCSAPLNRDISNLIESDYVDGYFQQALVQPELNKGKSAKPVFGDDLPPQSLIVRLVNLKSPEFEEALLLRPSTRDGSLHHPAEIESLNFR